jgi:hypothetical protein
MDKSAMVTVIPHHGNGQDMTKHLRSPGPYHKGHKCQGQEHAQQNMLQNTRGISSSELLDCYVAMKPLQMLNLREFIDKVSMLSKDGSKLADYDMAQRQEKSFEELLCYPQRCQH